MADPAVSSTWRLAPGILGPKQKIRGSIKGWEKSRSNSEFWTNRIKEKVTDQWQNSANDPIIWLVGYVAESWEMALPHWVKTSPKLGFLGHGYQGLRPPRRGSPPAPLSPPRPPGGAATDERCCSMPPGEDEEESGGAFLPKSGSQGCCCCASSGPRWPPELPA